MSTVPSNQPRYMAGATALREAMARKGMNGREVGDRIKVTGSRVSNWTAARSGIPAPYAQALGKLLGLEDWSVLDNSPGTGRRKAVTKKSTRQEKPGPAQRAVMLLEAREAHPNGHAVQTPSRASQGAGGVFGMQANADGTMAVWVRAADLPYDKGSALVRLLLDMGLVPGAISA